MKGLSISINVIVALALAMIVLTGLVAFFMGTFSPSSRPVACQTILRAGCQAFINAGGCEGEVTDISGDNFKDLRDGLECAYNITSPTVADAKAKCCIQVK